MMKSDIVGWLPKFHMCTMILRITQKDKTNDLIEHETRFGMVEQSKHLHNLKNRYLRNVCTEKRQPRTDFQTLRHLHFVRECGTGTSRSLPTTSTSTKRYFYLDPLSANRWRSSKTAPSISQQSQISTRCQGRRGSRSTDIYWPKIIPVPPECALT